MKLGRCDEAAVALGICEHAQEELARPMGAMMDAILAPTREKLDQAQIEAGRVKAQTFDVKQDLNWLGELARGTG